MSTCCCGLREGEHVPGCDRYDDGSRDLSVYFTGEEMELLESAAEMESKTVEEFIHYAAIEGLDGAIVRNAPPLDDPEIK